MLENAPDRGSQALVINEEVAAHILRHAREAYPNECCGALIGLGNGRVGGIRLSNTTEEGPRRRFLVRPSDYRAAEQRALDSGKELMGFYHSHPDHPARPSQYDLDHAWPFFVYVIIAVDRGEPKAMTSWRLREDRSAFEEEPVRVGATAPSTTLRNWREDEQTHG